MNDTGFEYKVGLFIVISVTLLALLILNFSKGVTLGMATYELHVTLPNAAGLKPTADVVMAGVPIGKVSKLLLSEDEKSVEITVVILSKYKIRKDAQFRIDSLGFLGDQYVSVSAPPQVEAPSTNEVVYLRNGDTVQGVATFNMLEAVQSISGVVGQAHKAIQDLDQAVTNVNATVLSARTLGRVVTAVSNIEIVSSQLIGMVRRADGLLATNEQPFTLAIHNFEDMSATLTNSAGRLDQILAVNSNDVRTVVTNLAAASGEIEQISFDLQHGRGTVGALLKSDEMKAQMETVVSNANAVTAEFATFGHNLNERGIWAMLWRPKPKPPETSQSNTTRKR